MFDCYYRSLWIFMLRFDLNPRTRTTNRQKPISIFSVGHSGHFMMIDRASDFIQMVTEIPINLFDTLTIYLPVVSSQKRTCALAFLCSKQLRGDCCRHFQGTWYSKLCLRPSFVLTQMIRNQKTLSLWGIIPLGNGWCGAAHSISFCHSFNHALTMSFVQTLWIGAKDVCRIGLC